MVSHVIGTCVFFCWTNTGAVLHFPLENKNITTFPIAWAAPEQRISLIPQCNKHNGFPFFVKSSIVILYFHQYIPFGSLFMLPSVSMVWWCVPSMRSNNHCLYWVSMGHWLRIDIVKKRATTSVITTHFTALLLLLMPLNLHGQISTYLVAIY